MLALANRHLVEQPHIPDVPYIRDCVRKLIATLNLGDLNPISIWELANKYTGPKRQIYLRAAAQASHSWRKTWTYVSMFVKPDKYPEAVIREKAPRAIQYRSPMYNLLIGRYLHVYEHALMSKLDGKSQTPFLAKGYNNQQRATILLEKVACFSNPQFICLDHSKFDSSISPELLKIEHLVYWKQFKSKWLRRLLRYQINNKGFTKSGIRYTVRGTRMSGDYNTGLGNSLINYLCLRSWIDQTGLPGEIFLDGDDSIVIVEKGTVLDETHFQRWGFTTKIGRTSDICEVEFCQSRLLPSGPVMARNPFRALSHLAVSVKRYAPKTWPRIQQARGMCEALGSRGVPILYAYGKALMNGTKPLFPSEDVEKWEIAKTTTPMEITDEMRLEYYRAWGIEPYMQELIEESFSDPSLLSVGILEPNSDYYDSESLRSARERWDGLDADRDPSWVTGGEGGMALL